MSDVPPDPAPSADHASLREAITDALRYWEPRRLLYNAALAAIVIVYFCLARPTSHPIPLTADSILGLFVLAVFANLCYCAAYIVDVFAQLSGFRAEWRRCRWGLLVLGIVFAGVLTRFCVLGFFDSPLPF